MYENRSRATGLMKPSRGIVCCACAASGSAATPPSAAMNSRRLMLAPSAQQHEPTGSDRCLEGGCCRDVRSVITRIGCSSDQVRFTPKGDTHPPGPARLQDEDSRSAATG